MVFLATIFLLFFFLDNIRGETKTCLYVLGGAEADPGGPVNRVDVYDFASSTWTAAATLPLINLRFGTASLDEAIYTTGGWNYASVTAQTLVYNLAQNVWVTAALMSTPRYGHGVAQLGGKIYAIGGTNGTGLHAYELRSGEAYDPLTSTWTPIAEMSVARGATAVAVLGDRLYAIGGLDSDGWSSAEAYDPKTGKWSLVASMNVIRWGHCAATVGDRIYAIGGYNGAYLSSVEVYDPKSNLWNFIPEMSTEKGYCGAVSYDDLLYVVGGRSSAYDFLDTIEVYSPVKNSWSILPARLPTPIASHAVTLLTSANFPTRPTSVVETTTTNSDLSVMRISSIFNAKLVCAFLLLSMCGL